MKKLFLLILITLFTIGTNAQSSETEFRFENFEIGRYYKVKISFGGEYNKIIGSLSRITNIFILLKMI